MLMLTSTVRAMKSGISAVPASDMSSTARWEEELVKLSALMDAELVEKSRSKMADSMSGFLPRVAGLGPRGLERTSLSSPPEGRL
jgi:hypothetical protein